MHAGASEPGGRGGAARPLAPVLAEVLGSAARRLRARLAARTGRDTPVFVEPARAATLGGLLAHLAGAEALWCVFSCADGPPAVVVLEEALLAHLIGPLFGDADDTAGARRAPGASEVERAVGARLARELVGAIGDAWTAGPAPRFSPGEAAPSPRVCDALDPDVAYLVSRVEIGDGPHGALLVAIPAAVVPGAGAPAVGPAGVGAAGVGAAVGAQGVEAPARAAKTAPPERPARIPRYERILPVELEVVVELARVTLPFGRLQALSVGDEIALGPLGDATGRVGDKPAVVGEAGSRNGARSLRVLERVDSSSSPERDDR